MKDLTDLKGLGPKTEMCFKKLGINNIDDLITFYPKRYDVIARSDMRNVIDGDRVIVDGIVEGIPTVMQLSSKLKKVMFRISNNMGVYNVVVFNQVYLVKELRCGIGVIVIGKYDKLRNTVVANEVRIGVLSDKVSIEPVYRLCDGLSRKIIVKYIDEVLDGNMGVVDYIPDCFKEKYHFMDKMKAIGVMHHPSNGIDYRRAKQRLKYEEFFWYLLRVRYLKYWNNNNSSDVKGKVFDRDKVNEFINGLSFELTRDQFATVNDIEDDMMADRQMNRLIQGDVGSGKTIVAFIACYMNYLSGYQSALMVPTEILANQHYDDAICMFKGMGINIVLLTSSISKRERNSVLKSIMNGNADIVIGTQSLIQSDVSYNNLGLIITDEQHRFGVNQRKMLKEKGNVPDVIAMSATPIPRTYALTIYGDMDVSSIKTKPKGRKDVSTFVISENDILKVLKMMKNEIDKGHQIYVIAPAIEGNENELNNVSLIYDKMKLAFGKICEIGYVHGKLDNDKKSKIMNSFENGDVKILITTTVIEVGVNVPNASMIVIFQANLFGLSTLHQLRGRVGRGSIDSYCILISKDKCERLDIMEKSNDGFLISEYDFKNRGEGDLFGIRQSGTALFKLADIKKDFDLLVRVKEDVDLFFDDYLNNKNNYVFNLFNEKNMD